MRKWAWVVGLAFVAGCGEYRGEKVTTYPVMGKVTTEDGEPLTSGSVVFVPVSTNKTGQQAAGEIKSDGTYSLKTPNSGDGAPEGEYHVRIMSADTGVAAGLPKKTVGAKGKFAADYSDEDTSGLSFTVKPQPNTFDIPLKKHVAGPKKSTQVRD